MPACDVIPSEKFLADQIGFMQTQAAENRVEQTLPISATVAAPSPGMQTTPISFPATPAPETATASMPNKATTPIDSNQSRPLPEGWAPRFWPKILQREFESCQKPSGDVVPQGTVRLDYELVLRGGRDEIVRVKSQLILPMALEIENLAQTDVSFPELVDQVIVRPLVTRFRAYLQRQFDAASASETKPAPPPPLPNNNIKLPKPANGAAFSMSTISPKSIIAKMPGSFPPPGAKSGV